MRSSGDVAEEIRQLDERRKALDAEFERAKRGERDEQLAKIVELMPGMIRARKAEISGPEYAAGTYGRATASVRYRVYELAFEDGARAKVWVPMDRPSEA